MRMHNVDGDAHRPYLGDIISSQKKGLTQTQDTPEKHAPISAIFLKNKPHPKNLIDRPQYLDRPSKEANESKKSEFFGEKKL